MITWSPWPRGEGHLRQKKHKAQKLRNPDDLEKNAIDWMEFHPFHILSNFFVVCLCVICCIMKLWMSKGCCYLSSLEDDGEKRALPSNSVRDWDSAKLFFLRMSESRSQLIWRNQIYLRIEGKPEYISKKYTPSYIVYKYITLQKNI